jgi:hypothetical protein
MAYGTVKVDNITFTNGGIDQTVTVSGIVQSISGNITATGTIQGQTIIGTSTVSGATVTGDVGVFTTVTGGSAGFTTVTGTTVTGTTANFVNGTFSTQVSGTTVRGTTVSGATITGAIGQFTTLTGGTAGFTTVTGTTVTGTTANFQSGVFTTQISGATVTGNVGSFSTITGGTVTLTSGVFGTGTAAAPSIAFTGDSNTGIYSPGADQVAVATNGVGRLFVNSTGSIGIGSGADFVNSDVHLVRGAGAAAYMAFTGNNNTIPSAGLLIGQSSTGESRLFQYGNNPITFYTQSSERLRITGAGLVGIGTSSPNSILSVSSGPKATNNDYLFLETTDASNKLQLKTSNVSNTAWSIQSEEAGIAFRNLALNPSGGNVGIGITTPSAKLTVAEATGTGAINLGDFGAFSASQNPLVRIISRNAANTSTTSVDLYKIYQSGFLINNNDTDASNFTSFTVGASERLRITSTGLVGIGTSSPGARLHVGSDALSGNWSGFFGDNLNGAVAPPAAYGLAFGYNRSGGSGEANIAYGTGTGAGLGLIFGSYDGTTYTNRVIFDGAGNVGIGTTTPITTLDVRGNASIGAHDAATVGVELGQGATGDRDVYIDFIGDTTYTDYGLRLIRAGSANGGASIYNRGTGALTFQGVESAPFVFVHGISSERARIDSSGRLLVGASVDSGGALLQVNGDRIRVATAKTPASATATGTAGEICWDASYIYVCTATDTWKRTAISTW